MDDAMLGQMSHACSYLCGELDLQSKRNDRARRRFAPRCSEVITHISVDTVFKHEQHRCLVASTLPNKPVEQSYHHLPHQYMPTSAYLTILSCDGMSIMTLISALNLVFASCDAFFGSIFTATCMGSDWLCIITQNKISIISFRQ